MSDPLQKNILLISNHFTVKIEGKTFEERILQELKSNKQFKAYRKIFNLYVQSLNLKPNTKSRLKSPERYDRDSKVAGMLMTDPIYSKAFSKHISPNDFRRKHIDTFRAENANVTSILQEIAARKAELVDKTPFNYEDNLALKVIENRLQNIYIS